MVTRSKKAFKPDFTKANPYEDAPDEYLRLIKDTQAYKTAVENGWITALPEPESEIEKAVIPSPDLGEPYLPIERALQQGRISEELMPELPAPSLRAASLIAKIRGLPEIEPPAPVISTAETSDNVIRELYPEFFDPARSYGYSPEQMPGMAREQLARRMGTDPQGFLTDLYRRTDVEQADNFLRSMGVLEEDIATLNLSFTRRSEVQGIVQAVFPDLDVDGFQAFIAENTDAFFEKMQTGGTSVAKRQLLSLIGLTPEETNEILSKQKLITNVNGIRSLVWMDAFTGRAFDLDGRFIGSYNPLTREIQNLTFEEKVSDVINAWKLASYGAWEKTKGFALSLLPGIIFRDMTPLERKIQGKEWANETNRRNKELRDAWRSKYAQEQRKYEDYISRHRELQPRTDYEEGVWEHPELGKDPFYWAYESASMAPVTVTALAAFSLASLATGGNFLAGAAAAGLVMAPVEMQALKEDLLANGMPEGQADAMALAAGSLIVMLESAGRLPVMKSISPALMRIFRREAGKEVARLTMRQMAKKGLTTFTLNQFSETATEVLQEAVGNAAVKMANSDRSLFEGLPEIAAKTFIGVAPFSLFGGAASFVQVSPSVTRTMTDAEMKAKGWQQDPKTGNWYERLAEEARIAPERGAIGGEFISGEKWDAMSVEESLEIARKAGIPDMSASMKWAQLPTAQKQALARQQVPEPEAVTPAPEVTVPKAKPGMPTNVQLPSGTMAEIIETEPGRVWEIRVLGENAGELIEQYGTVTVFGGGQSFKVTNRSEGFAKLKELATQQEIGIKRRPVVIPKAEPGMPAPEGTIPKPTRPLTEAEKPAVAEYYRKEAKEWRQLADRITRTEPTKEGEQRYAFAIQKAEAFEKAASEEAVPKAEARAIKYPATPAGAEARAKAEGISIAEASRLNAEEAIAKVPAVEEAEPTEEPSLPESLRLAYEEIRTLRDQKATTERVKESLVKAIRKFLPLPRQGEWLAKVKNVKTPEQLTEAIARVEEIAEAQAEKTLRADIIREVKRTAPRVERGITVGRLVAEIQPIIDQLRANLLIGIKGEGGIARNVEAYETARTQLEDNIAKYRDGQVTWEALLEANEDLKYIGMYGMNSAQLQEALDYIQEMKRLGKDLRKIKLDEIKEQRKEVVDKAVTEITGGKGIKPGVGTLRNEDLAGTKKVLDQPVNSQYGFVNLLDKLGKFATGTKMYKGFLMRFADLTQRATNTENSGREATFKIVRDKFREIYNVKSTRDATRLLATLSQDDVDLGIMKNTEGRLLPLKLTKAQMMEIYQLYKNPKNLETFKTGMKWTPEMIIKVVNTLTDQDIKWADWLQNEFYSNYYDKINPFYQQEFNIDMPKNLDYVPQSRDFEAKVDETDEVQMLLRDQGRYASVTNKSLKARQENIRPFQFKGVFTVLTNHIIQMEHFMAWAETMHELRSTFGNTEVRTAIRQYHSNDILRRLDDYMNDFARGGVDRAQFLNMLDKLRSNFVVSVLALKPSIGLQQIWTVGAFMTEMSPKELVSGVASFFKNPVANYQWMMKNSAYIKNRYSGGNYERDIRLAQQAKGKNAIAKIMSGQGNITQWLLWQVTQGDKVGVMPGWWAKYQAGLKEGLSQADAMLNADSASERTQNTSELSSLSWLQRGSSWGKLLTMFQSQPNKYFRIVADNIRNMQYGRQSKVKGITNLLIVWVLLPALFQWVADAFQLKKERQARILLLGPLNNILVAGQLIQTAWGWFTEDSFDWQASPVLSTVRDFQNFSMKLKKIMGEIADPYTDVAMDDIVSALEFFSKGLGQLIGAPTPYLIMVERAINDGDPRELVFSRWSLEEPPPTLQGKTSKLVGQLGQLDEDITDLPVDKIPPVYNTKKAFSEAKQALSKTLLSDVSEKNGFDPKVVAIAQTIMAQDKLETHSGKRLFDIIDDILSDNTLNYTYSQYYMDYQDRQKITSLAKLQEWDAYHPRYNLGNVTPEQYRLMRQYEALETEADRKQFRKDHPEMAFNPRHEYLRTHPKENALLSIHGQANILTKEAWTEFKKLVKELDYPENALPLDILPPESSIETHFQYLDMVSEGRHASWEAQLLLAKDYREAHPTGEVKAGERQSYLEFKGLEISESPIEALELKVKNQTIYDEYEALANDSDRKKFREEHVNWMEDKERIEAIERNGLEHQEAWVERWRVAAQFGANSSETKLWLIEHPDIHRWALDNSLLKDDGSDWNEAIIRLNVQLNTFKKGSREYQIGERKIQAHSEGFTRIDEFVAFYSLPEAGFKRDRYLVEHPQFALEMREKKDIVPRDYIPPEEYDVLKEKETLTPEEEHRIKAYDKKVPFEHIDNYVSYFSITRPADHPVGEFYEDDWFLMENRDFYLNVYLTALGNERRDFRAVPSRDVFGHYLRYGAVVGSQSRLDFRRRLWQDGNREFEDWMLLKGKFTKPIWEYKEESLEKEPSEMERFRRRLAEARKGT